jgi:hypothetical protein
LCTEAEETLSVPRLNAGTRFTCIIFEARYFHFRLLAEELDIEEIIFNSVSPNID